MAHSKSHVILALLLLNTACPAAGGSVMRVHKASIQPGGEVEMMQTESVSGLSKIANMFSDDNEAMAVTSKLLMLVQGTPSDDLLPFIQKLKKQIQPWHDKSTATLKAAVEEIESCTADMENGMRETEAKKGSCSGTSTSHRTHRTDESNKFTSKEQAKAHKAEKKEEMTTECNTFKAVKAEVHSATASYGGGDEGAYLESVSHEFCEGLLPRFRHAREQCTTATAAHTKASEIYETKNTAWTGQKSASDNVQGEMDVACCEYAMATKDVCTSHDTCYEDKVAAYKAVEAIIKGEEKIKKVEWRVYSRIECLLPVLGTDNAAKIDECRRDEHSTSHLDIEYPKIPEKSECTPEQDFPGTEEYKRTHFANLPEDAKGKSVAVCTGMNAVPPALTFTKVVYKSGTTGNGVDETITGTIPVTAGISYLVNVEVLRNDLASASEYVKTISLTSGSTVNLGSCNPDGGDYDCTFYNCHKAATITPTTSSISVSMVFTGHSHDCDCDTDSWQCSKQFTVPGRTPMKAVARFILTQAN